MRDCDVCAYHEREAVWVVADIERVQFVCSPDVCVACQMLLTDELPEVRGYISCVLRMFAWRVECP